jgi:hypothetical protein
MRRGHGDDDDDDDDDDDGGRLKSEKEAQTQGKQQRTNAARNGRETDGGGQGREAAGHAKTKTEAEGARYRAPGGSSDPLIPSIPQSGWGCGQGKGAQWPNGGDGEPPKIPKIRKIQGAQKIRGCASPCLFQRPRQSHCMAALPCPPLPAIAWLCLALPVSACHCPLIAAQPPRLNRFDVEWTKGSLD